MHKFRKTTTFFGIPPLPSPFAGAGACKRPPKETGVSGEPGAVDVAAISVHILYDDLIGSAGEKAAGRGGGL